LLIFELHSILYRTIRQIQGLIHDSLQPEILRRTGMKKIIVLLIAAAAGYGLLGYHFILLDSSVKILKKNKVQYVNTFVDARGSKKLELALQPDLIAAGIKDLFGQIEGSVKEATDH